jgi:hypothetical protein
VIGILPLFKYFDQSIKIAPIPTGDPKQKQKNILKIKTKNKKVYRSLKKA